jgi:leucyl/phenylalanyl-tRNA--protein transferase
MIKFPPVHSATSEGLVHIGGSASIENLVQAYKAGIFPWPISSEYPLAWFSPDPRGVIDVEDIHYPKSFLKDLKKSNFSIKINQNFETIISACSKVNRKNQPGTWITAEIIQAYTKMFNDKLAYCIGAYQNEELVGGLYGVSIGEFISGESMFSLADNASKTCLYHLLEIIQKSQVKFIDTQMVTPVIESFGGKNIKRSEFISRISSLDFAVSRDEIFKN